MTNDKRIVREEPGPQKRGRLPGVTGENPHTRATINTVVRTPNVWFRIESARFTGKETQNSLGGKARHIAKKAAREGHTLEYATRKQDNVVKLFMRAVVEG